VSVYSMYFTVEFLM